MQIKYANAKTKVDKYKERVAKTRNSKIEKNILENITEVKIKQNISKPKYTYLGESQLTNSNKIKLHTVL